MHARGALAGDFELPRITDCDDPGHCHDWAAGQYIDNFAGASVNWVSTGRGQQGTWVQGAVCAHLLVVCDAAGWAWHGRT